MKLDLRLRFLATLKWEDAKAAVIEAYPQARETGTLEGPHIVIPDETSDESFGMGLTAEEAWKDAATNL